MTNPSARPRTCPALSKIVKRKNLHLKTKQKIIRTETRHIYRTWIAVRAATIAGEPNPCVIIEKWVRCLCILGSRMIAGRVLQRGDLSWFNRSINSFVTNLKHFYKYVFIHQSEKIEYKNIFRASRTPKFLAFIYP